MISQHQANEASKLCDRMLESIAKIQRDFAEMQKAADEFNKYLDERSRAERA